MSQVHNRGITLKEMVRESHAILLVKQARPFRVEEKIPIHEDTIKYPPFLKVKFRFLVTEVIYNDCCDISAGKEITAVDQRTGTELHMHKVYHLEGSLKSPIFEHYETGADLLKEKELILFVSHVGPDESHFISYESVSKKQEVLDLIKKLDKRPENGRAFPSPPGPAPQMPKRQG